MFRRCWDISKRYITANLAIGFTMAETLPAVMQQYGGQFAMQGLTDKWLPEFRTYLSKCAHDRRRRGNLPSRIDASALLQGESWFLDTVARGLERQKLYRRHVKGKPELAARLLEHQDRQPAPIQRDVPDEVAEFFRSITAERERDDATE